MFRITCLYKHHEVRNTLNGIPHPSLATLNLILTLHCKPPKPTSRISGQRFHRKVLISPLVLHSQQPLMAFPQRIYYFTDPITQLDAIRKASFAGDCRRRRIAFTKNRRERRKLEMARNHAAIRAGFPLDATLFLVSRYERLDGAIPASRTVRTPHNLGPSPLCAH